MGRWVTEAVMLQLSGELFSGWSGGFLMMSLKFGRKTFGQWNGDGGELSQVLPCRSPEGRPMSVPSPPAMVIGTQQLLSDIHGGTSGIVCLS